MVYARRRGRIRGVISRSLASASIAAAAVPAAIVALMAISNSVLLWAAILGVVLAVSPWIISQSQDRSAHRIQTLAK